MKSINWIFALICLGFSMNTYAQIYSCPDPETTSLKWGEIPKPWQENPYSPRPQGEEGTKFVRANILVAGTGRGVICAYRNSLGVYSIWWPVAVKIPARVDYNWIEVYGGFLCTQSLGDCQFSVAIEP
ncbi:DUF3757 domain-containing protein [Legionella jordanis]|nr:DUF3757 domain-containing protein [Legionella jordanis]RMX05503.1 DUF3757 domain-containing protein [Legionella jordanis]RMX19188.1 DUF3757 domain-containing protein [Legionella jordanis]